MLGAESPISLMMYRWFIYCFTTLDAVNLEGAYYSKFCLAVPQQAICMPVCVRLCEGEERIGQCRSKNLAQVLLL